MVYFCMGLYDPREIGSRYYSIISSPIFSGYMEPDGSKHNLAGEWALVIFQFCKILRPDFI
jgi:hypothetical protein